MSREYPCVYYDDQKCRRAPEDGVTDWCVLGPCSHETPSNADRIRSMSDEELAEFFYGQIGCGFDFVPCGVACYGNGEKSCPCYNKEDCMLRIMKWLQQPAKEDRYG